MHGLIVLRLFTGKGGSILQLTKLLPVLFHVCLYQSGNGVAYSHFGN